MFTPINIKNNESVNVTLWDTHDIVINRNENNDGEIVIHPCHIGHLKIRFAKSPYVCILTLQNKDGTFETIDCDLGDDGDWGNVQGCIPGDCDDWMNAIGWGNDCDGHKKILRVTDYETGNEIPLEEFKRDVSDFIIYHEG